ncbi:MAG: alpha/beta fold hydrolase [Gaiellaceae bacterium]
MKVLLLHGWPRDERMWERQLALLLAEGFEAEAPRLYGRGPSIDGWAAQLLRDSDDPFVAVGASMGGYCALALARRAPERVVGMALVSSRADADSWDRRRYREDQIAELRSDNAQPQVYGEPTSEELAVAQEAMRDRLDLTGIVASFGGPLLVCIGDRDDLVSVEEALTLSESALQGSLEVFANAGHFLSLDQPERFDEVLLAFLAQWKT